MVFNKKDIFTAQDMLDEYAGMQSSEEAMATGLGYEDKETKKDSVLQRAAINEHLHTPLPVPSPRSTSESLKEVVDKLPFEIWGEILSEFLPRRGTIMKATLRDGNPSQLRLPREETKKLSPLLQVSRKLTASVLSMVFGLCKVSIHQDSISKSLTLLHQSRYLNSPHTGFGLGCIARMEVKWAPSAAWDQGEVSDFFHVLDASQGLVALTFFLPCAWWEGARAQVWTTHLQRILLNNTGLESVAIWRYVPVRDVHQGWKAFLDHTWTEVEAGAVTRDVGLVLSKISLPTG